MRFAPFVIAVLFLPVVRPLTAQEPPPVGVGDRMRFWTQQRRTVTAATITGWVVDSFTVSDTWIPFDRGRTTHAGNPTQQEAAEGSSMLVSVVRAGAVGALMGGVAGFLMGGAMNFDEGVESNAPLAEPATDHPCFEKNCAQIGAAIGAAAGLVLGAAFGVEGSSMLASAVRAGAAGTLMGGAAGFLVGGAMNIGADVADLRGQTDDPCSDKDCAQIGAAIGAAAGFVLGAAFGAVLSRRRPSSGQANVSMVRLHNGRLGVGASVNF